MSRFFFSFQGMIFLSLQRLYMASFVISDISGLAVNQGLAELGFA